MFRKDAFYDRKMVEFLLASGLTKEVIANGDISRKYLKFVKGKSICIYFHANFNQSFRFLFCIVFVSKRVQGDRQRLDKISGYVIDFVKAKRREMKKSAQK